MKSLLPLLAIATVVTVIILVLNHQPTPLPTTASYGIPILPQKFGDDVGGSNVIVAMPTQCDQMEVFDTYDTPSGTLEQGYYDASLKAPDMSTTTYKKATRVGKQPYARCHDIDSNQFYVAITPEEYKTASPLDNYAQPKTVMESRPQ